MVDLTLTEGMIHPIWPWNALGLEIVAGEEGHREFLV